MSDWDPSPIYDQTRGDLALDPLTAEPPPLGMVAYAGVTDWFTPGLLPRVDGWCEDRDPRADWELTELDGRE